MRYTRYEYKKHGKLKFMASVIFVVTVSIGSGLYISSFLFSVKQTSGNNVQTSQKQNESLQSQGVVALQCGYYSKKENADVCIPTISSYCQPFIVEENGNYRVIAGIYDDESGMKKLEELKSKGIDVAKLSIDMPTDTPEAKKFLQVVEGFIQITNKLEESDVKSIKTAEFKTWADNIISSGDNSGSEKLINLKSYVDSLPDEISRSNSAQAAQVLYILMKS